MNKALLILLCLLVGCSAQASVPASEKIVIEYLDGTTWESSVDIWHNYVDGTWVRAYNNDGSTELYFSSYLVKSVRVVDELGVSND